MPQLSTLEDGLVTPQARAYRLLPEPTLMDCILLTPLKKLRKSSHLGLTVIPRTPTSINAGRKRKSSAVSENAHKYSKERRDLGKNGQAYARKTRSGQPLTPIHTHRHHNYFKQHIEQESCSQPSIKRQRIEMRDFEADCHVSDSEDLDTGFRSLDLNAHLLCTKSMDSGENASQSVITELKHALDMEIKARCEAEEKHRSEKQRRIELEVLLKRLQSEKVLEIS